MSLNELYPESKRRIHELELLLFEYERDNTHFSPTDISLMMQNMSNQLIDLDNLCNKEPKTTRDDYKLRIKHLKECLGTMKTQFDLHNKKNSKKILLGNGYRDIEGGGSADGNGHLLNEANSIHRSSQMVDSYLNIGKNTLSELYSQRNRFKDVQSKVLDMLNYLGMSNNMMKTVEQRDFIDKIILFTCMVFTVVLLFALWWFVKYI